MTLHGSHPLRPVPAAPQATHAHRSPQPQSHIRNREGGWCLDGQAAGRACVECAPLLFSTAAAAKGALLRGKRRLRGKAGAASAIVVVVIDRVTQGTRGTTGAKERDGASGAGVERPRASDDERGRVRLWLCPCAGRADPHPGAAPAGRRLLLLRGYVLGVSVCRGGERGKMDDQAGVDWLAVGWVGCVCVCVRR